VERISALYVSLCPKRASIQLSSRGDAVLLVDFFLRNIPLTGDEEVEEEEEGEKGGGERGGEITGDTDRGTVLWLYPDKLRPAITVPINPPSR
jgi:hypothetical protein